MKLLLKQRMISQFYDIYDEAGNIMFVAKGKSVPGNPLCIYDGNDTEVGYMIGKDLDLFPRFEIYVNRAYVGSISKERSLFKPKYDIDYNGWHMDGDSLERTYTVVSPTGQSVALVSKKIWNWTDIYEIDVRDPKDVLHAVMLILAIAAEKRARSG